MRVYFFAQSSSSPNSKGGHPVIGCLNFLCFKLCCMIPAKSSGLTCETSCTASTNRAMYFRSGLPSSWQILNKYWAVFRYLRLMEIWVLNRMRRVFKLSIVHPSWLNHDSALSVRVVQKILQKAALRMS